MSDQHRGHLHRSVHRDRGGPAAVAVAGAQRELLGRRGQHRVCRGPVRHRWRCPRHPVAEPERRRSPRAFRWPTWPRSRATRTSRSAKLELTRTTILLLNNSRRRSTTRWSGRRSNTRSTPRRSSTPSTRAAGVPAWDRSGRTPVGAGGAEPPAFDLDEARSPAGRGRGRPRVAVDRAHRLQRPARVRRRGRGDPGPAEPARRRASRSGPATTPRWSRTCSPATSTPRCSPAATSSMSLTPAATCSRTGPATAATTSPTTATPRPTR